MKKRTFFHQLVVTPLGRIITATTATKPKKVKLKKHHRYELHGAE